MSSTYASTVKCVEHTSLVCGSGVSKAKRHRDIVVHAEGCDKRSSKLVGLFGGNRSRHQERIKVHIAQLNLQFVQFVAKEREPSDMLYLN